MLLGFVVASLLAAIIILAVLAAFQTSGCIDSVAMSYVFALRSENLWPCAATQQLNTLSAPSAKLIRQLPILFPWNRTYNTARLNFLLQQQTLPLLIVDVRRECDIVNSIRLAHASNLSLSVRCGGHCNENFSIYNPIVVRLGRRFARVRVNECSGVMTCQVGSRRATCSALSKTRNGPFRWHIVDPPHPMD